MFKALAKDTFYYLCGSIFVQVSGFLSLILIMRALPVEQYGSYAYAVTFVAIFAFVADGGFSQYVIKEIALHPDRKVQIYHDVQSAQAVVSLVVLGALFVSGWVFNSRREVGNIWILGAAIVLTGFLSPVFSIFIAEGRKQVILRRDILTSMVRLACTFIAAKFFPTIEGFAVVSVLVALILLGYCVFLKSDSLYGYLLQANIRSSAVKRVLVEVLPFTLLMIANVLFNKIDVIMLKNLSDEIQVGLYAGATQFVYPFMFVSTVLVTAIFPHLAQRIGSLRDFNEAQAKSLVLMAGSGLMLSVFLYITSSYFYPVLLGGKYDASIPIYRVLVWYLVIVFSYGVFSNALVAKGKVRLLVAINLAALTLNVGLNFVFLPHYGALGAAYTTLGCEIFLFMTIIFFALSSKQGAKA